MKHSVVFALPLAIGVGAACERGEVTQASRDAGRAVEEGTQDVKEAARNLSQRIEREFDEWDADRNGELTREEYRVRYERQPSGGAMTRDERAMFSALDTDGNGRLSRDELRRGPPN